jgi:cytochrome P450
METVEQAARLPRPPGPQGHWLLGCLPEFRRDALGFMMRATRDFGDVVSFRFGPTPVLLLSRSEHIERVLVSDARSYRKHRLLTAPGKMLFGQGLLTSEGNEWLRSRRMQAPAFHRQRIESYGETMVRYAEAMVAEWSPNDARDLQDDFMQLTLKIACKTLFNVELSHEVRAIGDALTRALAGFRRRTVSALPLPDWFPSPTITRMRQATRELDEVLFRLIRERRQKPDDRGDLLSMLMLAEDSGQMGDHQLRDELMTLFIAGHETSALALMWTFHLLAEHPEAAEALRVEVEAIASGRALTAADLPKLEYTTMVVQEAMRLFPPSWAFGREAIVDTTVGDYPVRKGTMIFISPWVLHRLPGHFENPETFLPARWKDGLLKRLPKFAYLPFGGGPRICIGNSFAMMEVVLVVASVARRVRFNSANTRSLELQTGLTLRSRHGIRIAVTERVLA